MDSYWLSPPQRAWMILILVAIIILDSALWGSRLDEAELRQAYGPPTSALIPLGVVDFIFLVFLASSIHGIVKQKIEAMTWMIYNVFLSGYWTAMFVYGLKNRWVRQDTIGGTVMGIVNVLLIFGFFRICIFPRARKDLRKRRAVHVIEEHYRLAQAAKAEPVQTPPTTYVQGRERPRQSSAASTELMLQSEIPGSGLPPPARVAVRAASRHRHSRMTRSSRMSRPRDSHYSFRTSIAETDIAPPSEAGTIAEYRLSTPPPYDPEEDIVEDRPAYTEIEDNPPPAYTPWPENIMEASLRAVEAAQRAVLFPITQFSTRPR
ncbi:Hypothetical protein D9617_18g034580 [Elsinoe fawcettii]|nr:Hypothetical protein D9617_18g034580 [Elsinoe fawcettii]